jgi:8-oxo-dGTP pyrophosphatase MutT (NUDIX family)
MANQQSLKEAAKYKTWHSHLEENQIKINKIDELYIERTTKDKQILYALLRLDADTPEQTKLNPICFIKGDAVSVLVVLIAEETNDKYVVLIRQRRLCNGSFTYEHPAGMIDEKDSSPIEVAARELGEETQLDVDVSELKPLFTKPLYSATATSDEALYFFYLERRLPLSAIKAMHGRSTGEESENEHTQLHIATLPEANQLVVNIHSVLAHLLYLKDVGDFESMKAL